MACVHLRQLIQLCEDHQLKIGGADMIHFVCEQCGVQEECPDMLMDEYDQRHEHEVGRISNPSVKPTDSGDR